MANPFSIEPANPLQALMTGVQGYDAADKRNKENQMQEGRKAAMGALQSGGDLRGPLAQLIGIGDTKGAEAIATFANQTAQREHEKAMLAETSRFHTGSLNQQGAALNATVEHQRRTEHQAATTPIKLGQSLTGDIYGVRDPSQPSGYRILDPSQLQQPQATAQAPQSGGVPFVGGGGQPSTNQPVFQPAASLPGGAPQIPHGDEFLKTIDPKVHELIKGVANYDVAPTTFSNRGQRERIINAVKQYDPSFDEKIYGDRYLTQKRFSSGPQGDIVRSMNVGIDHLATLDEYARALKNGDTRIISAVKNKFQEQFGYEAPTNFNAVKTIVGAEISKAIVGSRGAVEDRREMREPLNASGSPEQLSGAIKAYKLLMAGQIKGLKQQYESTGLKGFEKKLAPTTLRELGLNDKGESVNSSNAGSSNIPPPPPGFNLVQ